MNLKSLLIAAALAGSALASVAAPVSLLPSGPGMFSGGFTQTVDGLFVDEFTFSPASFSGLVSVSLSSVSGPVSFFSALLNGQGFSFFPELGQPDFSFSALVTNDTPLMLTVFGAVLDAAGNPAGAGSYAGVITAAAVVPEPQSLALVLAGLAMLGFALRRKQQPVKNIDQ